MSNSRGRRQRGGNGRSNKSGGKASRATIAEFTLRDLKRGAYVLEGRKDPVQIEVAVRASIEGTEHYRPEAEFPPLEPPEAQLATVFEVARESVLVSIERLAAPEEGRSVAALNFASAKNPGGGFQNGAQAQEEAIARSSALYPCLTRDLAMYKHHKRTDMLYSHWMIYSPNVVVFKRDNGDTIPPLYCSFVSSPAVNAGVVRSRQRRCEELIRDTMRERMRRVLHVMASHGHDTLVLGAFGCGVFANDPEMVATHWKELLEGEFAGRFAHVAFSVFGGGAKGEKNVRAFERAFNAEATK